MLKFYIFLSYLCLLAVADDQLAEVFPANRPLIIAHRGSSGMLPEHTVAAYELAIEQGADIIECDVVLTKDLEMVCHHDPWISDSTDVASHLEFTGRKRNLTVDGRERFDYFTVDFTLEELKTLGVKQSREYRDQSYNGKYKIPTLREYLDVAINSTTQGIYPELKYPAFFNTFIKDENNTAERVEDMLLNVLEEYGYNKTTSPCFIQSFELDSLEYVSNRTVLPLMYLSKTIIIDGKLKEVSQFLYGVGVAKDTILGVNRDGHITGETSFVDNCHAYGLKVHAYTFRNENQFLAFDYGADPYKEYEQFVKLQVDGFFTDFPQTFHDYLEGVNCAKEHTNTGNVATTSLAILLSTQFIAHFLLNFY